MKVLSIDPGFGETKVAYFDKEVFSFSFPSLMAEYSPTPLESKDKIVISRGGKKFVLGRDARVEPGCYGPSDYDDILKMVSLVIEYSHHLIEKKGKGSDFDMVVVSIPPGSWPQRNKMEALLDEEVKGGIVVPQGQGGYWQVREKLPPGVEYVLVLDLGYNTVDWLLIEEQGTDFRITKGATLWRLGIMRLVEIFKGELEGPLRELPPRVLREFLKDGKGSFYGEKIDLSGAKRRAEERYAEMLLSSLKVEVGEITAMVDAVIGIGGGIHYLDIRKLGHRVTLMPEKPEMANVEGQAKYILKEVTRKDE